MYFINTGNTLWKIKMNISEPRVSNEQARCRQGVNDIFSKDVGKNFSFFDLHLPENGKRREAIA